MRCCTLDAKPKKCPYCERLMDHTGTRYYITVNGIDREEICPVCYVRIELKLLESEETT